MTTYLDQRADLEQAVITALSELIGYPEGSGPDSPLARFAVSDLAALVGVQGKRRIRIPGANYAPPGGAGTASSAGTVTANRVYLYRIGQDTDCTHLAIEVATTIAGSALLGIYDFDTTDGPTWGRPTNLLATASEINLSVSTGTKDAACVFTAKEGHFLALTCSVAANLRQMAAPSSINNQLYGTASLGPSNAFTYLYFDRTYDGTLPSVVPSISIGSSGTPPGAFMKMPSVS